VEAEPVPARPSTRNTPLRGRTDIDLHRVGAPLCDGHPQPSSRDAIQTGVLVLKLDPDMQLETRVPHRHEAPLLVTGTLTNIRDGRPRLDGCGIGLFVQERLMGCQSGEWAEWGLKHDGRGTFSLCG